MADGSVTDTIRGQFTEAQNGMLQGEIMTGLSSKRARRSKVACKAPRTPAAPRRDEFKRESLQQARDILMEVHAQASLLTTVLDRAEQAEEAEDACVRHGGPELSARSIMARIREAQYFLDSQKLGSEASEIHHELFDVWSMAALAAHALACDGPLEGRDGESIVCSYPAIAAARTIQKMTVELTDRLDILLVEGAKKRAA